MVDFSACVTLKFDRWPWKQLGTSSILRQALCIISNPLVKSNWSYSLEMLNSGQNLLYFALCDLEIWWMTLKNNWGTSSILHNAICTISSPHVNLNWSYSSEMAKWVHDLCDLDLWPLTLTFCMDLTSVNGNKSWKLRMIRWQQHCQKSVTDGQTDEGRTDRQMEKCSKSCLVAPKNTNNWEPNTWYCNGMCHWYPFWVKNVHY